MSEDTKPAGQSPQDPYEAAYLDAKRFPLTTQEGLTLKEQKLIDAINMDDANRLIEGGTPLTPRQEARVKEFREKAALRQQTPPSAS